MHDSRWQQILNHLKSKYQVLEYSEPTPLEGEDCVLKETIVLQGEQSKTRFERYTRVALGEDPMDTTDPHDWLYSEKAITSYIRGFRLNEQTVEWEEFDTKPLFFKES